MNMAKYCKDRGMTIEQYKQFASNIAAIAQGIIMYVKSMYICGNGVYHDVKEIGIKQGENTPFIIAELKKQGMEFFDNNTLFRL